MSHVHHLYNPLGAGLGGLPDCSADKPHALWLSVYQRRLDTFTVHVGGLVFCVLLIARCVPLGTMSILRSTELTEKTSQRKRTKLTLGGLIRTARANP
jgi:hypothetical protein